MKLPGGIFVFLCFSVLPVSARPPEECTKVDCRDVFEASIYLGIAIDTFASGEIRRFLNPQDSSGLRERGVGGFNFAYRLLGEPKEADGKNRSWSNHQLWIYGETVHGARSTDVDCEKNASFPSCQSALAIPGRPQEQILFIIRNATSLEGFMGLRWEFLSLQRNSGTPASVYLKAQAGFVNVSDGPEDVADVHHVALGAIATKGGFEGSYLEIGFGRTELFVQKPKDRWKVDGLISRNLTQGISFFAQIVVDADIGSGSDSVQSYIGFEFDLRSLSDWFKM